MKFLKYPPSLCKIIWNTPPYGTSSCSKCDTCVTVVYYTEHDVEGGRITETKSSLRQPRGRRSLKTCSGPL